MSDAMHPAADATVLSSPQREFEKRADPKDRQQAALIDEMRAHIKKVCGAPHAVSRIRLHRTTPTFGRKASTDPEHQQLTCLY